MIAISSKYSVENRKLIKDLEVKRNECLLKIYSNIVGELIEENINLKGQLNNINVITIENNNIDYKDPLMLSILAKNMFKEDICFTCKCELKWDNIYKDDFNGRMYNLKSDKILEKYNWYSVCLKCYRLLNLDINKYILLDEINNINKEE